MPRLLNILVGFALLLSLSLGGVAHAAEDLCMPSVEAAVQGHADGDGDQAPHERDGIAHHHGGCHGHHNVAPFDEPGVRISFAATSDVTAFETTLGPSAPPGANLRPPIT